jgi:selenoprotein W-related protein
VVLVPSGGGVFEVDLDTERVYSKKATGKHPDFDELLKELRTRIP